MTAHGSAFLPIRRASMTAALVATIGLMGVFAVNASARTSPHAATKPTVVLVHGAFADASSWSGVVTRLQRQGYTVVAPANPLRGLASDSA